jgi:predicted signal transduction protein with EAL and GGDEF domain
VVGAEALVRWLRPEQGLVLPGEFIKVAEESGLIVPIGAWVQHDRRLPVGGMGGRRSRAGRAVGQRLRRRIRPRPNPGNRAQDTGGIATVAQFLELEITESAIMSHAEDSVQVLDNLRAMGLSLVIDDFGTGYSSLAYLKRLPLNKLKVDQSFVRGLARRHGRLCHRARGDRACPQPATDGDRRGRRDRGAA